MKKILFNKWKAEVFVTQTTSGYKVGGLVWYDTIKAHGKSQGEVVCPCCGATVSVYTWSFCGGGKRCTNCNVFLGTQGAYISFSEINKGVSVQKDKLVRL